MDIEDIKWFFKDVYGELKRVMHIIHSDIKILFDGESLLGKGFMLIVLLILGVVAIVIILEYYQ